ncbi:MAG: multicopper oxidase domain-containing protein [Candidatus Nitrosocosmicus sp.]|jgi:nitrite reductase (NO-forming)|uniref:multicopper oxidase domain-containing protein n=1 Tax=Candidatus Nitrosocosmicus agrestis TaxID=2563600 RepID=UPI00122E2A95|nr:multicopper oxidase domain-containing protein [Candidatus Nitrosocosmicus sp. SS]KAA2283145.1 multicopper oxidase domain-containing protein [Candidatus Nitrosocosmicus sp. SS]KAF0868601.1 copper oxidase [Candidatus Nitrosocosmicus sp. SS]MDR4490015.1 multicopper oxidase domain-containing protein [Candidatus Nitrosocosmicus sp.]
MDAIFLGTAFQKTKSIVLIVLLGFSLNALIYSNVENSDAVATTTKKTSDQANGPRSTNPAPISNTKEFTLIAEEVTLDISPSKKIKAWTYNGSIPGPTLRVTEGDKVIVHFINKLDLPHTIHFHGGHNGTVDGVFEIVAPNKTFTYEFVAAPSGALMYHCHVMPVVEHVRMGLYGAFIVDPKTPLPPAKEYVIVFGDYDTKDIQTSDPESAFYNGYENIYYDNPLPVYVNETARIYMINLSQLPAYGYHVHGTLFKTWVSGILMNEPIYTQTWAISSGDAAIFEMKWPWEGNYVFHQHGIPEDRGAMGYFNVTSPTPNLIDGKDIAITKPVSMINWQENLTRTLQNATAKAMEN